ncbi:MAG: hypothetical protein J7639_15370 [Paenibacillaceae bacterium]|nr:hypothetical protein [Paenibacillaceae bacterium]
MRSERTDDHAVLDIGSRVEMLVDEWLVAAKQGVALQLTPPVKREIVLELDRPWEGPASGYFSVLQEGERIRLYYRGYCPDADASEEQVACCAESNDGIRFARPDLGLYAFGGSSANNIVWRGNAAHNFAPFRDTNPAAAPEERYKALGGASSGNARDNQGVLYAFVSNDGFKWEIMQGDPVMTSGSFDSQNIAFWDERSRTYRCYSRYFSANGIRSIQSAESRDFRTWFDFRPNVYAEDAPEEHFYTNATVLCPGTNQYVAFPKRFFPARKKVPEHAGSGVSDAVFITSRDGVHWDRSFLEAWCRPGPDRRNWTQRSNMVAAGMVQTSPEEFSLYISEHYAWDDCRLRRVTVRRHGFASMHAGAGGGEFTTRPLRFAGNRLVLNYATSAAGSVRVELQDETGLPLPGYGLADMEPLYGDELDGVVQWKDGGDLSGLAGKPVKLRFVLRDADLYAIQFARGKSSPAVQKC